MKITNEQLRRIIKEEIEAVLEAPFRGDMTVGADPIHRQKSSKPREQSPRQKGHLVLAYHDVKKEYCLVFPSQTANAGISKFAVLKDLTDENRNEGKTFSSAIKQMFQGVTIPPDSAELNLPNFNAKVFNQELKRLFLNGCGLGVVTKDKVFYQVGFNFSRQNADYQPLTRCRKVQQAPTLDL